MFKLDLEKAEEPEIKLPTSIGSSKKQEFYFCFIDYAKAFDHVDHNKPWKILKEMGLPDHLTCLLRNLYAGQKATEHCVEQLTSSGLRKEYSKSVYCHPVYLTYIEYIMRNAGLDELQAGIKTGRRNINNLRYAMIPL